MPTRDTTPATATRMARKLIEQDKVDIILGPLSGSEGIAMRDYSKTIPDKTVINGISGALETTWVDPSPNFFRFNLDGAQWGIGPRQICRREEGLEARREPCRPTIRSATPTSSAFAVDFCKAGGELVERLWVPLGSGDYAGVIAKLPDNVDAIYLGVGGTDAINFLNQYQQAGGKAKLIGGSIMADPTVLSSKGKAKDALIGTPTSGWVANDNPAPEWQAYVKAYQDAFPADKRLPSPSLFGVGYHVNTLAMIAGLNEVKGDLSGGQKKFHAALSKLKVKTPLGEISLNENRQASGSVFVTEVSANADGTLSNKMVARVDNVTQTLGMTPDAFRAMGLPSRTTPDCKALGGK